MRVMIISHTNNSASDRVDNVTRPVHTDSQPPTLRPNQPSDQTNPQTKPTLRPNQPSDQTNPQTKPTDVEQEAVIIYTHRHVVIYYYSILPFHRG